MKEFEIRTTNGSLLVCVATVNGEREPVLETKHGKRRGQITVMDFVAQLNEFFKGSMPELYIATR